MGTQAKYHHLIPQTYLSCWANSSGTLKVRFLSTRDRDTVERNKEKIGGVNDFYSIKAGMPCCSESDAEAIFSSLSDYKVEYNGKVITDFLQLNRLYYDFDNWRITRKDGSVVSKNKLKSQINQVKIKDIEENFSIEYENKWNDVVRTIQVRILESKDDVVPEFDKIYLNSFFTLLDWRGFSSNELFEELFNSRCFEPLKCINIPKEDRHLPDLSTANEEMRHCQLLKLYREFLSNKGVLYTEATSRINSTGFHFLIADESVSFITSDSPAFYSELANGDIIGLLPITPKILMLKGVSKIKMFSISRISDDDVDSWNKLIAANATEFIIYNNSSV